MVFSEPCSRTRNREKGTLSRVLGTFWSWRRVFLIPDCYSKLVHYFESATKRQSIEKHCIQSPRGKNDLFQRARSWSLSSGTVKKWFLSMRCRNGRESTPRSTSGRWQNSEAFRTTSASQESKRNLASARLHTSFEEEWGSHHKICLGTVNTSTLQPRSTTIIFQPIWSPEGCSSRYKVWNWRVCGERSEKLATWAGQGTVPARHVDTCPWLVQGNEGFVKKWGMDWSHHSSCFVIFVIFE